MDKYMPYFKRCVCHPYEKRMGMKPRPLSGRESAIKANGGFKLHDRKQSRLAKACVLFEAAEHQFRNLKTTSHVLGKIGAKFPRVAGKCRKK